MVKTRGLQRGWKWRHGVVDRGQQDGAALDNEVNCAPSSCTWLAIKADLLLAVFQTAFPSCDGLNRECR